MDETTNCHLARDVARRWFAFAIPNEEAIETIAELEKPIVELGAGTGYWAWLGQQMGIAWTPIDSNPRWDNYYSFSTSWVPVARGSERKLLQIDHHGRNRWRDHALMLCWPPFAERMAYDCVKAYQGDTLVFVGEGSGGCTGDKNFWLEVEGEYELTDAKPQATNWERTVEVDIPQWPGMHDYLTVYRR